MDSATLLGNIYYGDEGLTEILIDGANNAVKIKITRITWLEAGKQPWECKLTVEDPWLVFEGAESIRFEPSGLIPNDFVEDISIVGQDPTSGQFHFAIRTGRSEAATGGPVAVLISAKNVRVDHPLWSI